MNSTGHYRRMLCAAGAAGLVLTLTGCSEKSEVPVKPVALGAHDRCALCGMVITFWRSTSRPYGATFPPTPKAPKPGASETCGSRCPSSS